MKPGTVQFRKHCERVLPQKGGEPKAQYLSRLARHFGFTASRMNVLYYDQRKDNARFTPEEYQALLYPVHSDKHSRRVTENKELRDELSALIDQKLGEQNAKFRRALEILAS
jgi:hypothetical protein